MSITEVREVPVNRSGEEVIEFAQNGLMQKERRFHRQFLVVVDSRNDGPNTILASPQIPGLLSFYQSGNDSLLEAVCTKRTVSQRSEGQLLFDVRCEYTTDGGERDNPEEELTQVVRWSIEQRPIIQLRDRKGALIRNVANDPFDPPPERAQNIIVANITRREHPDSFDLQTLFEFSDSVNDDFIIIDGQGVPPGWALFAGYDSADIIKDGERQKEVTYLIKILPFDDAVDNPEGHANFSLWDGEFLEHGPNYIASDGTKKPFTVEGYKLNTNLDKVSVPPGAALAEAANPQYSYFETHNRKSFDSLGFF